MATVLSETQCGLFLIYMLFDLSEIDLPCRSTMSGKVITFVAIFYVKYFCH